MRCRSRRSAVGLASIWFSGTSLNCRRGRNGSEWLRSNALESTNTIAQSRWTTVEQIGSRFPWAFFVVVVAWLAVIFASFGLFAPRKASVIAALLVAAIALAGPIFMMLEMDQPYGGLVKIPSTSLRVALDQMGRS